MKENGIPKETEINPINKLNEANIEKDLLQIKFKTKKNFKFTEIESIPSFKSFTINNLNKFNKSNKSANFLNFNFNKNKNHEINHKNNINMKNDKVQINEKIPLVYSFNNDFVNNNFQETFISKNSNSKVSTNYSTNFSFLNRADKNNTNLNITSRSNFYNHKIMNNNNYNNFSNSQMNLFDRSNSFKTKHNLSNNNQSVWNAKYPNAANNNSKSQTQINFYKNEKKNLESEIASYKNENLEKFSKQNKKPFCNPKQQSIMIHDYLDDKERENEKEETNNYDVGKKLNISNNINKEKANFNNIYSKSNKMFKGKNIFTNLKTFNNQNAIHSTNNFNNSNLFNHSVSLNEINENTNYSTCTNLNNNFLNNNIVNNNINNSTSDFGFGVSYNLNHNKKSYLREISNSNIKIGKDSISEEEYEKQSIARKSKSNKKTFSDNLHNFAKQKMAHSPEISDFSNFSKSYTGFPKVSSKSNSNNTLVNKLRDMKTTYLQGTISSKRKGITNEYYQSSKEKKNSEINSTFSNNSPDLGLSRKQNKSSLSPNRNKNPCYLHDTNNNKNDLNIYKNNKTNKNHIDNNIRVNNFSTVDTSKKNIHIHNNGGLVFKSNQRNDNNNNTLDNKGIEAKLPKTAAAEINLKSKDVKKSFSNFDLRILSNIQKNECKITQKQNILDKITSIKTSKIINNSINNKVKNKGNSTTNSPSPQEKKIVYIKRDKTEIIYSPKISASGANQKNSEFGVAEKPQSIKAEGFFGNEILSKNLIQKNLNKSTKISKKGLANKSLTEEEKLKLDNYFLSKENSRHRAFTKTSYHGGFFADSREKNKLETVKELKTNQSLNKSMQKIEPNEGNEDELGVILITNNNEISVDDFTKGKLRVKNSIDASKNLDFLANNAIQPVKRMKRPYFNYTYHIGARNAFGAANNYNKNFVKNGNLVVAKKDSKDDSPILNENDNNNNNSNQVEASENLKLLKRNYSSNDNLKNSNNNKNEILTNKNTTNNFSNENTSYFFNLLKNEPTTKATKWPRNHKVSKSVTFREPDKTAKQSLYTLQSKAHIDIRRRRKSRRIPSFNNINKEFELPEIEKNEKAKSAKKKSYKDIENIIKRRTQTADLIKRNVSSICNSQMNINNQILKPLISKDFKSKEFKLFKKFFKSSDEDVLMKMNDNFYESLKLNVSDNEEVELRKKTSEFEKKQNFFAKLHNPKDYLEKLNENKFNKNNLEIIEENEKEEKLQENLQHNEASKSKNSNKKSSIANTIQRTPSKKTSEKTKKLKSEEKNNKINITNLNLESIKAQSAVNIDMKSPKLSERKILGLFENAAAHNQNQIKFDNPNEQDVRRNLNKVSKPEKPEEASVQNKNNLDIYNLNIDNFNSFNNNNYFGELRKVSDASISNSQMSFNNLANKVENTDGEGILSSCNTSQQPKELINKFKSGLKHRKNNSMIGLNFTKFQRLSVIKGLNNSNIQNNININNINADASNHNNPNLNNSKLLHLNSNSNLNNINQDSNSNTNLNNYNNNNNNNNNFKYKKRFHSSQKLCSFEFDKLSNFDFIRNFNISFERKLQKDLLLSKFNLNLNTDPNAPEDLLHFNTHHNPLINKSFDFNIVNNSIDAAAGSSKLFLSNLNKHSNLNFNNNNKSDNLQMQNFNFANFYEKEILDSSCDSNSMISINIKSKGKSILNNSILNKNLNANSNDYINKNKYKLNPKKNKESEIFEKLNSNERKIKQIQSKLGLPTSEATQNPKRNMQLGNQDEFKQEVLGNVTNFVRYKRENEILKYDYMTRIDNGLVYKEDLKKSLMNKLIPGNCLNAETDSFKIEILQPKFIKSKFSKAMPSFFPGKPIIKASDASAKEYCHYYERKNLPKVLKDKDAFSVMTIFK